MGRSIVFKPLHRQFFNRTVPNHFFNRPRKHVRQILVFLPDGYADTPAGPRFEETTFPVGADTKVFLTTDGVIDQLGGPRRIAFGYSRFMNIVDAHASKGLEEILDALEREFTEYAGLEKRLDDVTVLAFRPGGRESRNE